MECNKDEAVRAKQMAESRLQRCDFVGALKFATKAKKLYADIEIIAQILTICEVHSAAQKKLSGSHMDWYGILQTERFSDEATMKKQYRKLALLPHPDKNKFAGAEAAFKLIVEANMVLSDQAKRSLYDKKCGVPVRTAAPKTSSHHSNGNAFTAKHDGNATSYQNTTYPNPFWNAYQQAGQKTFWTSCNHCKSKYQYYISFVNATLRCSKCLKSFTAHDLGYQGIPLGDTRTSFNNQKKASKHVPPKPASKGNDGKPLGGGHATSINNQKKASKHVPPKPASKGNGGKPLGGGHANKFVQSHPVSMKKCAARVGVHCKGEQTKDGYVARKGAKGNVPAYKAMDSQTSINVGSKRVRQSAPGSRESFNTGNGDDVKDANVQENGLDSCGPRRSSRQRKHVSYAETPGDDNFESPPKKSRLNESCNTDQGEKRKEPASGGGLSNNNNPASSAAAVGDQNREVRNKVSCPPEATFLWNKSNMEQFHVVQGEQLSKSDLNVRMSKPDNCSPLNSNVPSGPKIIHCLDTDFNDFEKNKAEDCFDCNQFWAIYDATDTMPRLYALVKKVASPFNLHITWLEPDPDDHGEISWFNADLPIACGKFKLGDPQKTTDHAMFSHQIHCIKGSGKGSYLVYPKKGETWAIFRDWDIKWSYDRKKHLEYEFEYVEILSDFAENVGIEVAYLGKVKGFVSFFQKTEKNGMNIFRVLPNELYRFSHRIPSYKMTGNEREGVPRGSFELDPAALPNLFKVGDSGDVKMESGTLNTGVEELMANKRINQTTMHRRNDAARDFTIL